MPLNAVERNKKVKGLQLAGHVRLKTESLLFRGVRHHSGNILDMHRNGSGDPSVAKACAPLLIEAPGLPAHGSALTDHIDPAALALIDLGLEHIMITSNDDIVATWGDNGTRKLKVITVA